jgi:hypothetical protein
MSLLARLRRIPHRLLNWYEFGKRLANKNRRPAAAPLPLHTWIMLCGRGFYPDSPSWRVVYAGMISRDSTRGGDWTPVLREVEPAVGPCRILRVQSFSGSCLGTRTSCPFLVAFRRRHGSLRSRGGRNVGYEREGVRSAGGRQASSAPPRGVCETVVRPLFSQRSSFSVYKRGLGLFGSSGLSSSSVLYCRSAGT